MIEAKIIADSVSENNNRITTFELSYPRFIHSELMTHRLFSRNAASSRAIPIEKMIEQVESNPAMPIEWGVNIAGMQAKTTHMHRPLCEMTWKLCAARAVESAEALKALGLHKQIVNRVLEPFQWMKTVVTATEFDNFFWLRCHPDAQPEIRKLAELMYEEYKGNKPILLKHGGWHVPYYQGNYGNGVWKDCGYARPEDVGNTNWEATDWKRGGYTLEQALKISASCCAQVSFRTADDSLEKAERIYDRLVSSVPVHASPFEHQAIAISKTDISQGGLTHEDCFGNLWSGNFKGWIQFRQLIPDNVCWDYKGKKDG